MIHSAIYPFFAGASVTPTYPEFPYEVGHALRFMGTNQHLTRTPASAGNRKLLAFRCRVKRSRMASLQVIASAGTASVDRFYFDASNYLCLDVLGTLRLKSAQPFRDPTGWHVDIGFQLDVANATASERAKILVDGVEISYSTDTRSSITNTDTNWNNTVVQYIGRDNAGMYLQGYIAEPALVDGSTAITYSQTNAYGRIVPAEPSATWGTNGFWLDFEDGTSTTTLGYDTAGSNDWSLVNMVRTTANASECWVIDTPTNNYATLDTLWNLAGLTISNAGLGYSITNAYTLSTTPAGIAFDSEDADGFTWECTPTSSLATTYSGVGLCAVDAGASQSYSLTGNVSIFSNGIVRNGSTVIGTFSSYSQNQVVKIWVKEGDVYYSVNGVAANSGNPVVTGITGLKRPALFRAGSPSHVCTWTINLGQIGYAYTPAVGLKDLTVSNILGYGTRASGAYVSNSSTNGPDVFFGGVADTVNVTAPGPSGPFGITWGTHAYKTSAGMKLIVSNTNYNGGGVAEYLFTATYDDRADAYYNNAQVG